MPRVCSRTAPLLLAAVAPWAAAMQPTDTQTLQSKQAEEIVLNTRFVQALAAALPDNANIGYLRAMASTVNSSMAALVDPPLTTSSVAAPANTTALLSSPHAEADASVTTQGLANRKDVVQKFLELVQFDSLAGLRESPSWSIIVNFVVIGILALVLTLELVSYFCFEKRSVSSEPVAAKATDDTAKVDEADDAAKEEKEKDPRRWKLLTMCYVTTFGSDLYMNSPLSFFPLEVYDRGASQFAVSLMLSIFPTGGMVSTYIIPLILAHTAPGRLVRITLLITGLAAAMIGAGILFRPAVPFVVYNCVVRFIEGLTTMMTDVAAQTIIMQNFDLDELQTVISGLSALRITGMLGGQPLGAALYSAGGWALTFMFGGVIILCIYVVVFFTFAREKAMDRTTKSTNISTVLFGSWRIGMVLFFNFGTNFLLAVGTSTQTLWLAAPPYHATPIEISATGIIFMATILFGTFLYTALARKLNHVYAFLCFVPGSIAIYMYGPTPILFPWFPQEMWAVYCLHAISGLCSAPMVSTTVLMTYISTIELKMKREEVNAPIISLCAASPLLGNMLGPLFGAPLVDLLGLRLSNLITSTMYMAIQAAMVVAIWKYRNVNMAAGEEVEPTDKQPSDAPAPAKGEDLTTPTHSRRGEPTPTAA